MAGVTRPAARTGLPEERITFGKKGGGQCRSVRLPQPLPFEEQPRQPWVRECLADRQGPFVAATDYMKTVADQIRQWVPGRYVALGTDGFGRSDARAALRAHFEVDRRWIVLAALKALADDGRIDRSTVTLAIRKFGIDPDKPEPLES